MKTERQTVFGPKKQQLGDTRFYYVVGADVRGGTDYPKATVIGRGQTITLVGESKSIWARLWRWVKRGFKPEQKITGYYIYRRDADDNQSQTIVRKTHHSV